MGTVMPTYQELLDERSKLRSRVDELERSNAISNGYLEKVCGEHREAMRQLAELEAKLANIRGGYMMLLDSISLSRKAFIGDHSVYLPQISENEVAKHRSAIDAARGEG